MKVKSIKNNSTTEIFSAFSLLIFIFFYIFALKITHRVAEHKNCSTTIQHGWKSKSDTTTENMREILFHFILLLCFGKNIVRACWMCGWEFSLCESTIKISPHRTFPLSLLRLHQYMKIMNFFSFPNGNLHTKFIFLNNFLSLSLLLAMYRSVRECRRRKFVDKH